jgi:hypothetical protein
VTADNLDRLHRVQRLFGLLAGAARSVLRPERESRTRKSTLSKSASRTRCRRTRPAYPAWFRPVRNRSYTLYSLRRMACTSAGIGRSYKCRGCATPTRAWWANPALIRVLAAAFARSSRGRARRAPRRERRLKHRPDAPLSNRRCTCVDVRSQPRAGGDERGAPPGAQAVTRDSCFSAEHQVGLFGVRPRRADVNTSALRVMCASSRIRSCRASSRSRGLAPTTLYTIRSYVFRTAVPGYRPQPCGIPLWTSRPIQFSKNAHRPQ